MTQSFKDLIVYKKAFSRVMVICRITQGFPKRLYEAHFISKISDADMENSETQVWLDFALACEYISQEIHDDLSNKSEEVDRMLNHMIKYPEKYRKKNQ